METLEAMRAISFGTLLLLSSCSNAAGSAGSAASSAPPAPSSSSSSAPRVAQSAAPSASAPVGPSLGETPADKLGTTTSNLGLKVGTKAPDAKLKDVAGKEQSLAALYKEGPTFVVFYRGGWCPFCNLQLHALTVAKPDFDAKGLRIAAISVDVPDEQARTQAKQGVPFPMLSDGDLTAHKAFNVVHAASDEEVKKMAGFGVDLEKYSGQKHHDFAVPSIFLVDASGVVRWVHVDEDFKTRPSAKQLLDVAARNLTK